MIDELKHHGVLGMKWGVRRYQNYDGTLKSKGEMSDKSAQPARQKNKINVGKIVKTTSDILTVAGIGLTAYSVLQSYGSPAGRTVSSGRAACGQILSSPLGKKKVADVEKSWADYAWEEVNKI